MSINVLYNFLRIYLNIKVLLPNTVNDMSSCHVPYVVLIVLLHFSGIQHVHSLNNGLARKPPMGWMSWTKFYCEIDCDSHPFSCINENLYKTMADEMISRKYLDAGYEYVHIDDCWMSMQRDANGQLVANSTRFSSGIPALADYMHKRGLKLGIYEDYGTLTCGGYPGSIDHLAADATTFAKWNVDYLKLDGCNVDVNRMSIGYPEMEIYLNETNRPIVYSCSWPAYLINKPEMVDYNEISKSCNLWRNFDDISRSWNSVMSIIQYYNQNQDKLIPAHGPGHWNDPDMIIVGNVELTVPQAQAQMTIWCMWSAPLIMSNDLRTITTDYEAILLNRYAIAIDQDSLGVMGRLVFQDDNICVYVKQITPIDTAKKLYSYAFAVLNHSNRKIIFESDIGSLGLSNSDGYDLFDIWKQCSLGHQLPSYVYREQLAPTSAILIRATLPNLSNDYSHNNHRSCRKNIGKKAKYDE